METSSGPPIRILRGVAGPDPEGQSFTPTVATTGTGAIRTPLHDRAQSLSPTAPLPTRRTKKINKIKVRTTKKHRKKRHQCSDDAAKNQNNEGKKDKKDEEKRKKGAVGSATNVGSACMYAKSRQDCFPHE